MDGCGPEPLGLDCRVPWLLCGARELSKLFKKRDIEPNFRQVLYFIDSEKFCMP